MTSTERPLLNVSIDLALVADAQRKYPCYVREIDMPHLPDNRGSRREAAIPSSEDTP